MNDSTGSVPPDVRFTIWEKEKSYVPEKTTPFLLTAGLLACLFAPRQASAQTPTIVIDDVDPVPVSITLTNLGAASSHVDPSGESGGSHGEFSSPNPLAGGTALVAKIWFSEPASAGGGLSDYLQITYTGDFAGPNTSVDGTFISTPDAIPTPGPNDLIIPETGGFQNVSALLARQQGIASGLTVLVRSNAVPEPGSMALLMGMAVSGGIFLRRRSIKRARN